MACGSLQNTWDRGTMDKRAGQTEMCDICIDCDSE